MSDKYSEPEAGEIRLKDIILKIKEMFAYLLSRWIILVLLGLLGGLAGFLIGLKQKVTYTAEITFVVEDGKSSGGLSGYSGLASQFGLDVGGASGGGLYQGDNIVEFLKSRFIIQNTLLKQYPADTAKTLADIFFEISGMKEGWDKNEKTKNMSFNPQAVKWTVLHDSALWIMHKTILRDDLNIGRTDKKINFIKASYKSVKDLYAQSFIENLLKEATDFYIQTKTKRSQTQVNNLQRRADSLLYVINQKTYSTAASQDININPAKRMATVNLELNTRDKSIAQTIYIEVVKNLELAKASLAQDNPIIQVVDRPILPLVKERKSKLRFALVGAIIAGLLGIVILLGRRIWTKIMA